MTRLFEFLITTLSLSAVLVVGVEEAQQQLQHRSLQTELCSELNIQAVLDPLLAATPDACECGTEDLNCEIKNACISSDGADPIAGDYTVNYSKEGEGETYTQLIVTDKCFDFPSDMYGGATACFKSTVEGIGGLPLCYVTVNGQSCSDCLYCARESSYLTFNCSNIGFDDRGECIPGNANGTILQFLYEPELVDTCKAPSASPGMVGGSSGMVGRCYAMVAVFTFVTGVLSLLL